MRTVRHIACVIFAVLVGVGTVPGQSAIRTNGFAGQHFMVGRTAGIDPMSQGLLLDEEPAPMQPGTASSKARVAKTPVPTTDSPTGSRVRNRTSHTPTLTPVVPSGSAVTKTGGSDDYACPLCESGFTLPCGKCANCKAGFPCEYAPCRHCVQPRDLNTCSFCDLTAGDEPCGTCDACMEHRSAPCEHADDGHGPKGEFNPYHQSPLFATPSRLKTGFFNNGAHRFPIYYNPAPYYRPTWNPAMFGGYMRPFTFRWVCEYCHYEECQCVTGPRAGQTVYGYNCKVCGRNPCACAFDICKVNKDMKPDDIRQGLQKMAEDAAQGKPFAESLGARGVTGDSSAPGVPTPGLQDSPTATTSAAGSTLDDELPSDLESDRPVAPNGGE